MSELSNYVIKLLRDDGEFVVSRAQGADLPHWLVVSPASECPPPMILERLKHAYALRDELDPSWATQPAGMVQHAGKPALLLRDTGGMILADLCGQPMELSQGLRLAIGIASALGGYHGKRLIHRDVNPGNLMVEPATGAAWLTGFGLTSRLPLRRQTPEPPGVVAGTLAYMAPEQTGRMNRSIDSRSDLYSLGVTLYEMFVGALPFTASDPMEWVHCHIARQPTTPSVRVSDLPEQLSAIIMKLLAKAPEERYQTATGAETDLRRCLKALETHGRIESFPLGQIDVPDRLIIPEKLYGRTAEIETLLAAFDRVVSNGRVELVLVSGYSGVGKSSVVNELHKVLVPPRGLFASGKFDQFKRDIPYATLAQALQKLVRQILVQSDANVSLWRTAFEEALGPNGQLMVGLVPDIELITGKLPPVADLPPQDAQRRFQIMLRRFIGVFARPEHPLVLFLDDLQWLDTATLELIEHLVTYAEMRHLMLVGAYRDNEVQSGHPLMRTVEAIQNAGVRVPNIVLLPLGIHDLAALIADALCCHSDRARPLAELLLEKTDGNPFFAIQFISSLVEENLIAFDHSAALWKWDVARIRARGFADNVAELMAAKLGRLPIATQHMLGRLACLGSNAAAATLGMSVGEDAEQIHILLGEVVRAGFLFRQNDIYTFTHDRVQEAAYALVPETERAKTHLQLGKLLVEQTPATEFAASIFEIVNQLNRGLVLIEQDEEREQLAELNLQAAQRAKASAAFVTALKYLTTGCQLLSDDCWERKYRLAFQLGLLRAECEFVTGLPGEAERRLSALSLRAKGLVDKADVTRLQMPLHTTLDRGDRAIETGLAFLREAGIDWKNHPDEQEIQREYHRLGLLLGECAIEELIDLPLMLDEDRRATLNVLVEMVPTAMVASCNNLVDLALLHMANLSMEHGLCDGSAYAFASLNVVLGFHFNDYQAGLRFGEVGCALVTHRGLDRFKTRAFANFGIFTVPWTTSMQVGRAMILRGFDVAQATGDVPYAIYCSNVLIGHSLISGEPLENVCQEAQRCLSLVEKAGFGLFVKMTLGELRLIQDLRGFTNDAVFLHDARQDGGTFEQEIEEAGPQLGFAAAICWTRKLQRCFFAGDFAGGLAAALKAAPHFQNARHILHVGDFHFYSALVLAAAIDHEADQNRAQHFEALRSHHRQIVLWAESCPENFENRKALVSAEMARVEGRELDAMRFYEQAIRSAGQYDFVQNEGLANELAARFYAARGFDTIADAYLRKARDCYHRWGAEGKVRQLELTHSQSRGLQPPPHAPVTRETQAEQLDRATVFKASQALSSEIVLPELIRKLMTIVLEDAGAERGLLVLIRDGNPTIEAEGATGASRVEVTLGGSAVTSSKLPESVLNYVMRSGEPVVLDDATESGLYSEDEYVRTMRPRSVLCLPIFKQTEAVGALYLENRLTPCAFPPVRVAMLELLASQAAISLENARLYSDLERENLERKRVEEESRRSEREFRQAIDIIPALVWSTDAEGANETFNQPWHDYTGISPEDARGSGWINSYHTDDVGKVLEKWREVQAAGEQGEVMARLRRFDGEFRSFLVRAKPLRDESGAIIKWYGTSTDIEDQKESERALERSKVYLEHAQELSHTGSVSLRLSDGQLFWSEETARIYGYDPAIPPTMEMVLARVHPDDLEFLKSVFERAAQGGASFDFEHRLLMPDGTIKFVRSFSHSVKDEEGREEVLGAVMDITERKRVEMELRRSEALLAEAQGLTRTSSLYWKVSTGEIGWTDECFRLMEYPRSMTPTVQAILDRCHPEDLPMVQETIGRSARDGTNLDFEHRLLMPDGAIKHVHVVARNIGLDPQNFEFVGAVADVTEQAEAKQALERALAEVKESEDRFRTIIETIPELVWGSGPDGSVDYLSQQWLSYTGLSAEEAQGHGWTAAIHPDDIGRHYEHWLKVLATKTPGEVESRLRHHDGAYRWFLFRAIPLIDQFGYVSKWYGANTDIDDLKKAETLLAGEKRLFEMIATGHSLSETLKALCHIVEELVEGSIASILLMDGDGKRLRHGAAPSLPPAYLEAIDGGFIGPCVGSCGTAAYLKEKVYSADIATDPLWIDYAELALNHDLRACFSTPILSSETKVLGTFAFYSKQARPVTLLEDCIADQFTNLAGILIERKRAEDALAKSEALLAEGQRISQTGSWIWNVTNGKIVWSEEHCRIFGFSIDQLTVTLESFLQTVHPPDLATVQAVLDDAIRRGCEFSIEYRIGLSDGSMKHIHGRGHPIVGEQGRVEQFVGTVMDISYRHEARLALENAMAKAVESEDQLRKFIDAMPGLLWTAGPNGESVFLSQGWADYTGMTMEALQGLGWVGAVHPDDVEPMVETWEKISAAKKAGEQERRLRRFDGVYRWFTFREVPLLDQRGDVVKWFGINVDIEDQKSSAEEMRKLVSLIENSTDCIGFAQSPLEVSYLNSAWRRVAGLDADVELGQYQFADFLPASEYRRFMEEIAPILERDGHWEGEQMLRNMKTNAATPVHQTIFFILEPGTDRRIGMATICRDISERKRAEEELRRSEADLRKAQSELAHVTRVTTMGELAASIAHEVNQPIAGVVINGNACLRWLSRLNEESDALGEAREAVQRIIRDGTRAGEVIARIRALFKKTESAMEPLQIDEVIREVIVLARSEMDKRRISLRLEFAIDLPRVIGDRVQLQQVLLNLILNGIDAMSEVEDRPQELFIGASANEKAEVLVSVCDSGVGVDPASVEALFAAFHTTKPGGLGMGLSISRSIVENHGGRLWATANEDVGATFQFTLLKHLSSVEASLVAGK